MSNTGLFFKTTLIYFIFACALTFALRDMVMYSGLLVLVRAVGMTSTLMKAAPILLVLFAISWWTSPSLRECILRLARSVVILLMCCVFLAAFSTVKSSMPLLGDMLGMTHFYADEALANLDKMLHFGVDPWIATHALTEWLGLTNFASQASILYGLFWALPALYLPAILFFVGEEEARTRHFIIMFAVTWIGLGNVLAFVGFSAGPIFYDAAFGTERFTELHASLAQFGLAESWIGETQGMLWSAYADQVQQMGTGISAFPSLHVAMTTVFVLYFFERNRYLGYVGLVFLSAIQFISVWSGYHYAIDGYASMALVYGLHRYLKRDRSQTLLWAAEPTNGQQPKPA